ncbi:MAG: hypothetical protein O2960_13980 [Verrucomicrobia bacterium]|nr:hypothetical protein [Verrucomicrobiota bacterium]
MNLSTLSVGLGVLIAIPQIFGLLKPAEFAAKARRFPRSVPVGYLLMGIGTIWFLRNLRAESISDFEDYKKLMLFAFGSIGVLTCVFVKDFLAVRGLSVVLLLTGKLMLDTARWNESEWRLVIATLAYVWIISAIWFTVSPWRLRDIILWSTASEKRIKVGSGLRLALALFVIVLGLTVF